MPKKKGSKKSAAKEYCRGYVDEHGQWNNGFYCPQWGGPGRKYCCGPDNHRVCCPKEQPVVRHTATLLDHLPLILGVAIGCLVVLVVLISVICYFCQGCWVYRRRKRLQHGGSTCGAQASPGGRTPDYAVSYSVCPHPPYIPDGLGQCYPLDDPPPYPGDPLPTMDEKQPLNPSHLYVAMETPDEALLAAGRREHVQNGVVSCTDRTNAVVNNVTSRHGRGEGDDDTTGSRDVSGVPQSSSGATAIVRDSSSSSGEHMVEVERLPQTGVDYSADRGLSSPQRTHQMLLNAVRGRSSGGGGDSERLLPAYSKLDTPTEQLIKGPKPPTCSKATCSSFSPSKSIELGAFLRTLSERGRIHPNDVTDDVGEPQQTTKLLADGDEDIPIENETGDDDGTDQEDDITDQEDNDDDDDGSSEMTSCPDDNTLSLEDCTVQIIPQG